MSDLYSTGQPIRLSTTVRDIAGTVTDPTALTLTYGPQGGSPATKHWPSPAEVTRDSAGVFHCDIAATLGAGHYLYRWTATGTAAGEDFDVFDVFDPATYPRIVSFGDAKAFLGLTGTSGDDLLDRITGWASARILREYQATQSTVTERVELGPAGFVLSATPARAVTTVTAVTPYAPVIAAADVYVTNQLAGTVALVTAVAWGGVYDVTYTAGSDEVPPAVSGACESLIRHWWNQSQAHGSATYGDTGFVPDFKGLPNVVRNMLASVPRVSGIA